MAAKIRIIFMGTPEFSVKPLKYLFEDENYEVIAVVSQPDKPRGRKGLISPGPVKATALDLNIPVYQPIKMKDEDFIDKLISLKPDFILTAAFGRILPEAVLDIPSIEALNLHASLLPKYRGAAPMQRAVMNGEKETGVSLMRMDAELDHGAVFSQRKISIGPDMNISELSGKLSELAAEMAVSDIKKIYCGELCPENQDDSEASYAKILKKEDGRIDFSKGAKEIHNLIRAISDWPSAFADYKGKRLQIYGSRLFISDEEELNRELLNSPPGTLVKYGKHRLILRGGDKYSENEDAEKPVFIEVLRLKLEGGREMDASDFAQRLGRTNRLS